MKVLFDSTALASAVLQNTALHKTGIYRYGENLAKSLNRLDSTELSFYSTLSKNELRLWDREVRKNSAFEGIQICNSFHPLQEKIDDLKMQMIEAPKMKRLLLKGLRESYRAWLNSSSALNSPLANCEVFYSPYHPIPKSFQEKREVICFTMVHDLIPLKYPGYFEVNKRSFFDKILKKPKPNQYFIAPSKTTKADICHFYSIDPEKVFVIPGAVNADLFYPVEDIACQKKILKKYNIDAPFILSLATLEPRKNINTLIDAYIKILQEDPAFDYKLVLAGAKGWGLDHLKQKIKPYQQNILLPGFIADQDLAALYSAASVFIFPSLYEGFGFPPLEAMSCNTPVIASDRSSIPEVVQNAGLYIDPTNVDDIAAQIQKLTSDRPLQEKLRALGQAQAKKFSWTQTAKETLLAFETSLSQKN